FSTRPTSRAPRWRGCSASHDRQARPSRYGCPLPDPLRAVIGEDDVLLREGIVRLLTEAGFEVVAQAGDSPELLRKALSHRPAVVIADGNSPPDHADDGL